MKFLIHCGEIIKNDGKIYFISSQELIKLYKIDTKKHTIKKPTALRDFYEFTLTEEYKEYIHLYPLSDEDYEGKIKELGLER